MRALLALFGKRGLLPSGFHDYRQDELAKAFGIERNQAAQVLHDYHALLNGKAQFAQEIPRGDLYALTNAAKARFRCGQREGANIATWFGRLVRLIRERTSAIQLGLTEKTWMSVCQHGGPSEYIHHLDYDGERFNSQTGLRTTHGYLLPGALIGCRCHSRSIIPGFEDD